MTANPKPLDLHKLQLGDVVGIADGSTAAVVLQGIDYLFLKVLEAGEVHHKGSTVVLSARSNKAAWEFLDGTGTASKPEVRLTNRKEWLPVQLLTQGTETRKRV